MQNKLIINLEKHFLVNDRNYKKNDSRDYFSVKEQTDIISFVSNDLPLEVKYYELENLPENTKLCLLTKSKYESSGNIFLDTILTCFAYHLPFVINPEMIRYLLLNGFGKIIENNPSKYKKFLFKSPSKEKEKIHLSRNEFLIDFKNNDWHGLIDEFVFNIKQMTSNKDLIELSTEKLTTTSSVNNIVNNIAVMNCFSSYVQYSFSTRCGIPEIELWGTVNDWIKIKELIICIGKCELEWWTNNLIPIIDNIIDSIDMKINYDFWKSIIKCESMSGGDYIDGYLARFFPLNRDGKELDWSNKTTRISTRNISRDLSNVPVSWNYFNDIIELNFVGGNFAPFITSDNKIGIFQGLIIGVKDIPVNPELIKLRCMIGQINADINEEKKKLTICQEKIPELWNFYNDQSNKNITDDSKEYLSRLYYIYKDINNILNEMISLHDKKNILNEMLSLRDKKK